MKRKKYIRKYSNLQVERHVVLDRKGKLICDAIASYSGLRKYIYIYIYTYVKLKVENFRDYHCCNDVLVHRTNPLFLIDFSRTN